MAYTDNFYLNGPTLSSSTCIFTDSAMTDCANNGYYSDGTIVRQLLNCILLPQQQCTECGFDCGSSYSVSGNEALYSINIDTGSSLGAIIIKFSPFDVPDGIKAVFNGITYNKLSFPGYGFVQGDIANQPTFIGQGGYQCSILDSGGDISLPKYIFNGVSFVNTGLSENVHIDSSQVTLDINPAIGGIMVIPKITNTQNILNLYFYSACASNSFTAEVQCPALLPSYSSTVVQTTEPTSAICSVPMDQTYYFAKVHTDNDTYVGINDWVFSDPYGGNVLPNGWYRINRLGGTYDTMRVLNGIVVDKYQNC